MYTIEDNKANLTVQAWISIWFPYVRTILGRNTYTCRIDWVGFRGFPTSTLYPQLSLDLLLQKQPFTNSSLIGTPATFADSLVGQFKNQYWPRNSQSFIYRRGLLASESFSLSSASSSQPSCATSTHTHTHSQIRACMACLLLSRLLGSQGGIRDCQWGFGHVVSSTSSIILSFLLWYVLSALFMLFLGLLYIHTYIYIYQRKKKWQKKRLTLMKIKVIAGKSSEKVIILGCHAGMRWPTKIGHCYWTASHFFGTANDGDIIFLDRACVSWHLGLGFGYRGDKTTREGWREEKYSI